MSKKELLSESQIRRFMTLANLEPLANNVLSEKKEAKEESMYEEEKKKKQEEAKKKEEESKMEESLSEEVEGEEPESEEPESEEPEAEMPELEDEEGEDQEGDMAADGSVEDKVEQIVNLVMDLAGVQGKVMRDDEEDVEEPSEEPMEEAGYGDGLEEMDPTPTKQLSEDALVEAVLARVTARLVQEAKKKTPAKKETPEQKMKRLKAEKAKKKKTLEEATSAEGGGPLLKQGKNKYDVYKGHADMAYAKGKEGKGGHQMEPLAAKADHSVTHGGKNLATLGGNKTKV